MPLGLWGSVALGEFLGRYFASERSRGIITSLGVPVPLRTEDRRVLECIILPFFADQPDFRCIVFVGCAHYTRSYERLFRKSQKFITIDHSPETKSFGARHHFVAPMGDLDQLLEPASVDLVVCNGVVGWGLNERGDVERSFEAAFTILRPGGVLLVGWNDEPPHNLLPPGECTVLGRFERYDFEPLQTCEYRVNSLPAGEDNTHVYNFYRKPAGGRALQP